MATMLFTDIALRQMKAPSTGRVEVTDAHPDVKGFTLRITKGGAKTFNLVFRSPRDGRQARIDLGSYPATALKEARRKAIEYRRLVESGVDPRDAEKAEAERRAAEHRAALVAAAERDHSRLEVVAAEFITVCRDKRRLRQWREYERQLTKYVVPRWGERHVREISREDCRALLRRIEADHGPVMANRVLATVRSLFTWLLEADRVSINPASRIRSEAAEISSALVLSDGELAASRRGCDRLSPIYAGFVRLLMLTAQRRREVATMRWRDLDLDAAAWTLPREAAKMARLHVVPLPSAAVDILRSLPRYASADRDAFVFTTDGGRTHISGYSKVKSMLDAAVATLAAGSADAAVEPWRLHDLRRTAASGMARLGVALHVIEKVLGHESGSISGVAAIYNRHGYDREKREALAGWAGHVAALVDHADASDVGNRLRVIK
jgi:integrase